MTPQRFQEIREVFEVIVSEAPEEREAVLRAIEQRDVELAKEVKALLGVHERRASFIEKPVARLASDEPPADPGPEAKEWIGPYRLMEKIGEGGMGEVWKAEQTRPVRRIVALKLIKAGMDTREVVRRFESERQALAVMEHPAIAKIFFAGTTPQGRPFFAMEYVDGVPVTVYCDRHRLNTRERLKLFQKVCEGVQHAHQKAILHRDVKPSNVLVTEVDGRAQVKIIDFGVARAISPEGLEETALTRLGAILGTPDYMSPEQASVTGSDIDTRTDVYSLGVVLYELLVGGLPYDLRGLPLADLLRKVSEEPAPRPSTRFRELGMDADRARQQRATPPALYEQLRGDLDAIVLKAIEKDRGQRYGSPAELAADIGRYLANEPVEARPANALYVVRKYVQRHRAVVGGAAVGVGLLVALAVWQNVQIHRITRERDRADRITQFMTDMFRVSDPGESRGNQVTAREILDRAAANIETGLSSDRELQAKLMRVMGRVYYRLGLYPQAESLLRRSLEAHRRIFGGASVEAAQLMSDLGNVLSATGKREEAKQIDQEVLAIRKRELGSEDADTLKAMNNVAVDLTQEGKYKEAAQLQEVVYAAKRRVLGEEDPSTLLAMENLGDSLANQGRLREAEELERGAVEIKKRTLGADHPETLRGQQLLAETLYNEGRYREAEALARETLRVRTKVLGAEHRETLLSLVVLANPLENEGRLGEAEQLLRKALEAQRRVLGQEHPDTLLTMNNLAGVLAEEGRFEEAERLDREVVEIRTRKLGPEDGYTLRSVGRLAQVLAAKGALEEAEGLARRTREWQMRVLGKDSPETATTIYTLACVEARKGRGEEALGLLREALEHGLRPNVALGLEKDPNLKGLHGVGGFKELVSAAKARGVR